MIQIKNSIKDSFARAYNVPISVVRKNNTFNPEHMNKILFENVISILKDLEEDSKYLKDAIGIDLSGIEGQYFQAIDGLLRMNFTDPQIQLINFYIYELPNDEESEPKMEVVDKKKVKTYSIKTPEDLWNVLKVVK